MGTGGVVVVVVVVVVGGSVVEVVVVVGGVVNLDSFTATGSGWSSEVDLRSVCGLTVGAGARFGDGAKPTISARVADCSVRSMMARGSSSPVGGSNAAKPAIAMVAIASHASAASRRE